MSRAQTDTVPELRVLAWEVTRACNLACRHCRANAQLEPFPGELDQSEGLSLIDQISRTGNPILIFTGGEPLLRQDIFQLIERARANGLRCAIAPNGTLLDAENARLLAKSGIERASISIDSPDAAGHNAFRGVEGAFEASMRGIEHLRQAGIPFQINTTVTKLNLSSCEEILRLARDLGAVAWHIFLLVPTGRGSAMKEGILSSQEYERILNWFYDMSKTSPIQLKATCAPQYHRILRQRAQKEGLAVNYANFGMDAVSRGCLGGNGFCFISHSGQVQPCGYLELDCGQVREEPFPSIWRNSKRFRELRDPSFYSGKCGVCEYERVCGGCRARAQTMNGSYLAEEPLCAYQPRKVSANGPNG
ncbi:MAG: heme b synthase [Desulfohalobiaceae bacterium]|nr:heme b synthase [Desulfohalobiaceae bacterium]